jgi:hypothetical protein
MFVVVLFSLSSLCWNNISNMDTTVSFQILTYSLLAIIFQYNSKSDSHYYINWKCSCSPIMGATIVTSAMAPFLLNRKLYCKQGNTLFPNIWLYWLYPTVSSFHARLGMYSCKLTFKHRTQTAASKHTCHTSTDLLHAKCSVLSVMISL